VDCFLNQATRARWNPQKHGLLWALLRHSVK